VTCKFHPLVEGCHNGMEFFREIIFNIDPLSMT